MNGRNYEVPHCGAFSTPHSHPSWVQIFASGSCFQIPLACTNKKKIVVITMEWVDREDWSTGVVAYTLLSLFLLVFCYAQLARCLILNDHRIDCNAVLHFWETVKRQQWELNFPVLHVTAAINLQQCFSNYESQPLVGRRPCFDGWRKRPSRLQKDFL